VAIAEGAHGAEQTVYVLDETGQPKPLRLKLGISDGTFVAVQSGPIEEGQQVVIGMATPSSKGTSAPAGPGQQPGGGRRGPGF